MTQVIVVKLIQPAEFSDPLTEVLREGARALLAQAVEAEVTAFLSGHADKHTEDGRQRLVRHGHRPERAIMTGLGPVAVRAPRVRDRIGAGESRIRFTSAILPPYARRSNTPTIRRLNPSRRHQLPRIPLAAASLGLVAGRRRSPPSH